MEHEEQAARVRQLLAELTDWHPAIEHILSCADCRNKVLLQLASRQVPDVLGPAPDPGPFWLQLEVQMPGLLAALDQNAAEARELEARLMAHPFEEREALCSQEEFRSLPLATRLLFESETVKDPEGAAALARLGYAVACQDYPEQQALAVDALRARACVLLADALRRMGDLPQAAVELRRAGGHLNGPPESSIRAFFCEALALLRVDQGRNEEAVGLLWHAVTLYGRCGDVHEQAVAFARLGRLWLEEGKVERAKYILTRACAGMDFDATPALAARSRTALAFCYAATGGLDMARRLVENTQRLVERLTDADDVADVVQLQVRIDKLSQKARNTR